MKQMKTSLQKGFTLVELLIVVIIIAILASILVPQFSSSTDDAKVAALDGTLANVRSAIDLYYQQHGKYPSAAAATGGATCSGTSPGGAINTDVAFVSQLAYFSNSAGQACSVGTDPGFDFGPYIKKAEMPVNPLTGFSDLTILTAGDLVMPAGAAAGTANKGWIYDNVNGRFIADHVDYDDR